MRRGKSRPPTPRKAPDDLALVQEFINTWNHRTKRDAVGTPRALGRWLERRGLLPADVELEEADRKRAVAVRRSLRSMAGYNSGGKLDHDAIDRLDQAVTEVRFQLRFDADGSSRFEPVTPGVDAALGKLLEIVTAAQLRGTWKRFKVCGTGDCWLVYYDATGRSKWCSRRCGDRMRSRAYRRGPRYKLVHARPSPGPIRVKPKADSGKSKKPKDSK